MTTVFVSAPRFIALVAFALPLVALSCDGDDTPPSFFDSGSDATSDAPPASDASDAALPHAKIIAVHASPDLAAVRFCFGVGLQNDGSDAVVLAVAPTPSVAPGGGAALPDLGVDLSQKAVTPYAVLTSAITTLATCDALVAGDAGLASGTDFFALPTIKNGTLAGGTTILAALTGCASSAVDPSGDITTCGSTYAASGNLAVKTFSLDRVVANSSRFGAQIAHVSTPATGVWTALYTESTVNAVLHPLDGGADEVIAQGVTEGSLQPSSAASLAAPNVDQTSVIVSAVNPDGGATSAELAIPMPLVYEATTGATTGENAYFDAGANYTFVFVGDPREPTTLDGGAFNGYALHLLAFPNDPTLPP